MNVTPPRLALLWRPEDAAALATVMGTEVDEVFPVSQKTYSAALAAGLKLSSPIFSNALSSISLDTIDHAAERAVALAVARNDPRGDFDRTALWHNAREMAFLKRAMVEAIRTVRPSALVAVGDVNDAEAQAVARLASRLKLACTLITPSARAGPIRQEILDPPSHLVADLGTLSRTGGWTCVLGIGATDWQLLLRQLRRPGYPIVVIADERHSGDLAALYKAAAQGSGPYVLPLWRETTRRYAERGDNSGYAADVRAVISKAISARPSQAAICDIRRTETAVAVECFRRSQVPLTIFAHAGASMMMPYRFSDTELGGARILVWTATAARDYGGAKVEAPRRIRTDALHRAGRLAQRMERAVAPHGPRCVGVVMTSDALFAAPEFDLDAMLRAFATLADGLRDTGWRMRVRLRSTEDSPDFFRSVPGLPHVDFEDNAARDFVAFARECDLVVELGSESSAFLEAAGSGVPYLRTGSPRASRTRFGRPSSVVPRLDANNPWTDLAPYLNAPLKRLWLAKVQSAWLMKETRPGLVEP